MTEPYIPLPSEGASGMKPDGTATATCLCGAVQLSFPVEGDDLVTTFVCNCTDCHKISSSMFCANFIVTDKSLTHVRGEDKLTRYSQNKTIESGAYMKDSFCAVCGNLMYRRSSRFPGTSVLRVGTVDDFNLHATKLKPRFEAYTRDRVAWFDGVKIEGIPRYTDGGPKR
ncbi:Mss4-like protein [Coniochaeta sp. 2T2.1]|nr:Mss4-like protein [Coniochaeta sp. 2T2.1]